MKAQCVLSSKFSFSLLAFNLMLPWYKPSIMLDRLYHQLQVRIIFCGKENVYGLDEDSFVAIIIGQHMLSVELTNMV